MASGGSGGAAPRTAEDLWRMEKYHRPEGREANGCRAFLSRLRQQLRQSAFGGPRVHINGGQKSTQLPVVQSSEPRVLPRRETPELNPEPLRHGTGKLVTGLGRRAPTR